MTHNKRASALGRLVVSHCSQLWLICPLKCVSGASMCKFCLSAAGKERVIGNKAFSYLFSEYWTWSSMLHSLIRASHVSCRSILLNKNCTLSFSHFDDSQWLLGSMQRSTFEQVERRIQEGGFNSLASLKPPG